eukprot:1528098-Amphidinium_carterae.1
MSQGGITKRKLHRAPTGHPPRRRPERQCRPIGYQGPIAFQRHSPKAWHSRASNVQSTVKKRVTVCDNRVKSAKIASPQASARVAAAFRGHTTRSMLCTSTISSRVKDSLYAVARRWRTHDNAGC